MQSTYIDSRTSGALEFLARRRLERSGRPISQRLLVDTVRDILARGSGDRKPQFSLSTMIRGLAAMKHRAIEPSSAEADIAYVKALQTGSTPGSYVVPTIQSDAIIGLLSLGAVHRAAGARVWGMERIQSLTVPAATVSPTFQFLPQNTAQTPDSAFGAAQLKWDLIEHRALILAPAPLFTSAVPSFEAMLPDFLAEGCGESEAAAMFATSTLSNSPLALMSAGGVVVINAAGSANGGNLLYSDLTALLEKSAEAKVKPPLSWFASPRTFNRLLSLQGTTSMPILTPTSAALPPQAHFMLLGWPLYLTAGIPNNEAVGSGSNQSHLILTNAARCLQVAEDRALSIDVSTEFAIDANQIALRVAHRVDFQYLSAGICVLAGIN